MLWISQDLLDHSGAIPSKLGRSITGNLDFQTHTNNDHSHLKTEGKHFQISKTSLVPPTFPFPGNLLENVLYQKMGLNLKKKRERERRETQRQKEGGKGKRERERNLGYRKQ